MNAIFSINKKYSDLIFSGYKKRNNFCNKCDDWLRNIGYYNESDEAFWKYKIYIKEAVRVNYPPPKGSGLLLNGSPD